MIDLFLVTDEINALMHKIGFNEADHPTYEHCIDYLDRVHKVKIEQSISATTGKYKYAIRAYNPLLKVVPWECVFNPLSHFTRQERDEKAIIHAIKILQKEI
jgi:hypothetical protein